MFKCLIKKGCNVFYQTLYFNFDNNFILKDCNVLNYKQCSYQNTLRDIDRQIDREQESEREREREKNKKAAAAFFSKK